MKKLIKSLVILGSFSFLLSGCKNIPIIPSTEDDDVKKLVSSVTLDAEFVDLEIGDTASLNADVVFKDGESHEIELRWVTSDPAVAIVENGFVTAIGGGKAAISVIAGYKMDSCSFSIKGAEEDPVPPGPDDPLPPIEDEVSLSLNPTSKNMTVGESFKIIATVSPATTPVSWQSSNEDVATVGSDGTVKAIRNGNAVITATADKVSKTCSVFVGEEEEEEEERNKTVNFYIDYNNIDPKDTTGTKLLASFKWYKSKPLSESGLVPADPEDRGADEQFRYFIGWSSHTIIDSKEDLWDMEHDTIGYFSILNLYGIWSDVPKGEFNK